MSEPKDTRFDKKDDMNEGEHHQSIGGGVIDLDPSSPPLTSGQRLNVSGVNPPDFIPPSDSQIANPQLIPTVSIMSPHQTGEVLQPQPQVAFMPVDPQSMGQMGHSFTSAMMVPSQVQPLPPFEPNIWAYNPIMG
jgi:hypothetical protein